MAIDPIGDGSDPQMRAAASFTHDLFDEHARMVYGLCRALLRDPDDADDATQATFIAAYRSLLGGSCVREPAAWLATIARNECTARARAGMREPLPLLDADLGHADGPEAALERQALVAELQHAIASLPEKQREAVVLRDLYGLHYTEVGAALGISVASVESLLFRARRSLRVSLKPLASGALTVPVAVREGIAQALPVLSGLGTGGGATSGVIGLGLLAKLAGGPAAMKAAAGLAAAVAAGSIAVAGVERRASGGHARQPPVTAAPSPQRDAIVEAESVGDSAAGASSAASGRRSDASADDSSDGRSEPSSGSAARFSGEDGHGSSGRTSDDSGSSPSSRRGSGGSGGSDDGNTSAVSGPGGPPTQPEQGDDTPAGGRTSSSGPGGGDDAPRSDDHSGAGGSGGAAETESSGDESSGPGDSATTTTSAGDGDDGRGGGGDDSMSGHSGDGESHGGQDDDATAPA